MMRYIILSADTQPTLYEAPDEVADHLFQLANLFLEGIHHPKSDFWVNMADPSGESYLCLSYNEQDFVAWLNKRACARAHPVRAAERISREEREIIMETARRERYYPHEQQQYPWFNF